MGVPPMLTAVAPPKLLPVMVKSCPLSPDAGLSPPMTGAGSVT